MRVTLRTEACCSCFRRSTTLLVVLGEWLLLSKKPTPQGFVSRSAYEGTAYSTLPSLHTLCAGYKSYVLLCLCVHFTQRCADCADIAQTAITPLERSHRGVCEMQFSIMVMVIGAVIAGATDLTFSVPGYIWVAVCAVSTAVYLLLIRLLKDKTGECQLLLNPTVLL